MCWTKTVDLGLEGSAANVLELL